MADPFDVRVRFTNQLVHLNASTASATKAAHYAFKYAEFSEDLFSCIIEQLERPNMNLRANIMYFLPALCDLSRANGALEEPSYVSMLERDIVKIIDLVAPPDDSSGAANVKVVRRVLQQLLQKQILAQATVAELEEYVAARDSAPASPHPVPAVVDEDAAAPLPAATTRSTPRSTGREAVSFATANRPDKKQIEQRIEEDRERHKRAREGIWAVGQKTGSAMAEDREMGKLWHEGVDLVDDDLILGKEEAEERRRCIDFEDTG